MCLLQRFPPSFPGILTAYGCYCITLIEVWVQVSIHVKVYLTPQPLCSCTQTDKICFTSRSRYDSLDTRAPANWGFSHHQNITTCRLSVSANSVKSESLYPPKSILSLPDKQSPRFIGPMMYLRTRLMVFQ